MYDMYDRHVRQTICMVDGRSHALDAAGGFGGEWEADVGCEWDTAVGPTFYCLVCRTALIVYIDPQRRPFQPSTVRFLPAFPARPSAMPYTVRCGPSSRSAYGVWLCPPRSPPAEDVPASRDACGGVERLQADGAVVLGEVGR